MGLQGLVQHFSLPAQGWSLMEGEGWRAGCTISCQGADPWCVSSLPLKVCVVSSSRPQSPEPLFSRQESDASISPRTSDSSVAPVADFDYPPEFSSCLDNSAAKHKLLVKPRNQWSSKMRRLSSVTGQGQGGWAWSPICPQYRLPALKDPCPLRNPHRLWDHDHASGSGVGQGFNIN